MTASIQDQTIEFFLLGLLALNKRDQETPVSPAHVHELPEVKFFGEIQAGDS